MGIDELMDHVFWEDQIGNVWCFSKGADLTKPTLWHLVSVPVGVNPEFRHVLGASLLQFQVNRSVRQALETLADLVEKEGNDQYTMPILKLIVSLKEAEQVSITGLREFGERYKNKG